ncbi:hypothetical protein AT728_07190 [Streptomyces silvensis]|uniref:Uncharacterized protein n=1 Tax=Streptomyces silvensis TaxID=1765722 RepID=A0A0W7X7I9_9ACTN|nr:hypothetical protein AT728_07190 [Streptomyces silvensis]
MSGPVLVDDFRVSGKPDPKCDVCQALDKQRREALDAGNLSVAASRAREIRECRHGRGKA